MRVDCDICGAASGSWEDGIMRCSKCEAKVAALEAHLAKSEEVRRALVMLYEKYAVLVENVLAASRALDEEEKGAVRVVNCHVATEQEVIEAHQKQFALIEELRLSLAAKDAQIAALLEIVEGSFLQGTGKVGEWRDSMCLSASVDAGNALIAAGLYEEMPGHVGVGRRRFYRRIVK